MNIFENIKSLFINDPTCTTEVVTVSHGAPSPNEAINKYLTQLTEHKTLLISLSDIENFLAMKIRKLYPQFDVLRFKASNKSYQMNDQPYSLISNQVEIPVKLDSLFLCKQSFQSWMASSGYKNVLIVGRLPEVLNVPNIEDGFEFEIIEFTHAFIPTLFANPDIIASVVSSKTYQQMYTLTKKGFSVHDQQQFAQHFFIEELHLDSSLSEQKASIANKDYKETVHFYEQCRRKLSIYNTSPQVIEATSFKMLRPKCYYSNLEFEHLSAPSAQEVSSAYHPETVSYTLQAFPTLFGLYYNPNHSEDLIKYVGSLEWTLNSSNFITKSKDLHLDQNLNSLTQFFEQSIRQHLQTLAILPETFTISICWANKNHFATAHHNHYHSNSFLSGVYYLSTNNAKTVFMRSQPPTFFNPTQTRINEWNATSLSFQPEPGALLLFSSNIFHSVECNPSEDDRITIAFNVNLTGEIGDKNSGSYIKI